MSVWGFFFFPLFIQYYILIRSSVLVQEIRVVPFVILYLRRSLDLLPCDQRLQKRLVFIDVSPLSLSPMERSLVGHTTPTHSHRRSSSLGSLLDRPRNENGMRAGTDEWHDRLPVPTLLGYEVMEERAKFTVSLF